MRPWLRSLAALLALAGMGALLGSGLGPRFWPLFAALALGGLAALAWSTRLHRRGDPAPRRRSRARPPIASEEGYDLESDTSTDEQRWLM